MRLKFRKSHGGRQEVFAYRKMLKKDITNDCSIRAMVHFLFGESDNINEYIVVRDQLFDIAKEMFRMPNDDVVVESFMNKLGFFKQSPITVGNTKKKYKVGDFPNDGKCIMVRLSKHWTCIYGDVILDTWDCREWAAQSFYSYKPTDEYNAWMKMKNL